MRIIILIITLLFFSCGESRKKTIECKTTVNIEQTEICLPNLKGLSNISNDNNYKSYIKQFKAPGNNIIGFYIDNSLLNEINKPNYKYASIYVNSQLTKDINSTVFKQMSNTMGSYLKKADNLKAVIKDIEENYLKNISLESPIIIDSYSLNDNIKTYLLLGKTIEFNNEIVTLTTLNLMHIQNKMVLSNYIIKYKNSSSIDKIKQKNDYFVMRIIDANK